MNAGGTRAGAGSGVAEAPAGEPGPGREPGPGPGTSPPARAWSAAAVGAVSTALAVRAAKSLFGLVTPPPVADLLVLAGIAAAVGADAALDRYPALLAMTRNRWLRRTAGGLLAVPALGVLALAVLLVATPGVQDAGTRAQALAARQGVAGIGAQEVAGIGAAQDRLPAPRVVAALVAVEDQRFWTNPGVDLPGVVRAARDTLRDPHRDAGGSTLEQQLAKSLYTGGTRSWTDQVEQVALALKLAHTWNKRDILQMYLSTADFGHGYHGLDAAARGYFDSAPDQLTWRQAALLAGLVQAPERDDPFIHPDAASARCDHVLQRLQQTGSLTRQQVLTLAGSGLQLRPKR